MFRIPTSCRMPSMFGPMSLDSKSFFFDSLRCSPLASVITAAQASARKNPNKSFALESTCGGGQFLLSITTWCSTLAATMAGGVFWVRSTHFDATPSLKLKLQPASYNR
jgi:hypothetical protein